MLEGTCEKKLHCEFKSKNKLMKKLFEWTVTNLYLITTKDRLRETGWTIYKDVKYFKSEQLAINWQSKD